MMKRVWACLLIAALLLPTLAVSAVAAGTKVTRCNVRLRKQANANSDTLWVIEGGVEITVLGTSGGWTKTTYMGHTGYVATENLMELTRSGYYPLKEGDSSPYVAAMQERLIALGYLTGKADGEYGKSTLEAVKNFQKNNNIAQDGVAGGETQRVMFNESAKMATGAVVVAPADNTTVANTTATEGTANKVSNTTLRQGSRGDDVKTLQQRLIELGYLSGKADGVFGVATEKAVIAFQKRSSLTADGKAGKVTQNLLYSTAAKTASDVATSTNTTDTSGSTTYATLKRGMTNNSVKTMQEKLKQLGYMSASATGYFGSATYDAVVKFQRANGLASDGVAGSLTQQKLYGSNAVGAGSSEETADTSGKTYATLKEGMKSSAVTTMQKKLRELGYMSANATGYFGSATKQAVVAFQRANSLTADGVAGSATLNKLYGGGSVAAGSSGSNSNSTSGGQVAGPSGSSIKLLHWFNNIKPSLKQGSVLQVYDPATGYTWKLRAMSLGRHCDSEPLTAEDTMYMNAAFGGVTTWTPKPVYVKLPSGTWTMATTHNVPHLTGGIKDNNFDGHLCVHFLRDMDEVSKNDPNYGVQNQKTLRDAWKKLSGQTVN